MFRNTFQPSPAVVFDKVPVTIAIAKLMDIVNTEGSYLSRKDAEAKGVKSTGQRFYSWLKTANAQWPDMDPISKQSIKYVAEMIVSYEDTILKYKKNLEVCDIFIKNTFASIKNGNTALPVGDGANVPHILMAFTNWYYKNKRNLANGSKRSVNSAVNKKVEDITNKLPKVPLVTSEPAETKGNDEKNQDSSNIIAIKALTYYPDDALFLVVEDRDHNQAMIPRNECPVEIWSGIGSCFQISYTELDTEEILHGVKVIKNLGRS
jgi:hypothetical protein